MKGHSIRIFPALLAALLAWPLAAPGQGYPAKPVRLVVPNPPGGSMDGLARPTAQRLSELLGQPVIVDNRPGAGGTIAGASVAKSAPDGYTIYIAPIGHFAGRHFFKSLPFDSHKDFTPISNIALIPNALVVQTSMPVNSMKELLEYAKKQPGKIPYGTYAIGSINHLAGILISQITGIGLEHVPYKGGAPAIADMLAGQLPMAIVGASTVLPHARAGKLRMLGVIENRRFPSVPGVPSIGETVAGYAVPDSWFSILGPAGLPRAIVERLNVETRKAVLTPEVKQRLENLGFEVTATQTPDQFAATIKTDSEIVDRIIASAGIKPD